MRALFLILVCLVSNVASQDYSRVLLGCGQPGNFQQTFTLFSTNSANSVEFCRTTCLVNNSRSFGALFNDQCYCSNAGIAAIQFLR
ncbi:uncharacterized protein CLUP02_04860 [Colletotrichum lupini]|uniref:WSC domain-containing protein n=1 Tax=Colletotrichum lupini TaxID=145971 RepID=A0A9Q8SL53_9PEZI|nr:uncharacterized protein CLUP02_04860 [Colletotrichum lupini]UQC79381.1 hypothetical protein CLUP02_04860 [Colletotrichum lupini]